MFPASIKPAHRLRNAIVLVVALVLVSPAAASAQVSGPVTSANAQYVVASYTELLGRGADTGGLDFHLEPLASGGSDSRRVVAYGMLFSVEGSRQEVERAYDEILQRTPDGAGATYWTNHLSGRGVLDLRVLLLASDEFHLRAGGTDSAWLDALYDSVLDRTPESAGRVYWLGLLGLGLPRALIAGAIYQSDEALGNRVDAYYQDVLSRAPTSAERSASIDTVRRSGERYLRAELWASDEAFEPFLTGAWS